MTLELILVIVVVILVVAFFLSKKIVTNSVPDIKVLVLSTLNYGASSLRIEIGAPVRILMKDEWRVINIPPITQTDFSDMKLEFDMKPQRVITFPSLPPVTVIHIDSTSLYCIRLSAQSRVL